EGVPEPVRRAVVHLGRRAPARCATFGAPPPPGRPVLLRQEKVAWVETRPREHGVTQDPEEARSDPQHALLAPLPARPESPRLVERAERDVAEMQPADFRHAEAGEVKQRAHYSLVLG